MTQPIKQHPLSAIFPAIPEEEFKLLVQDIKENGQQEFIVMHQGKILDGQHRYLACLELGLEPKLMTFRGKNAEAFVISKNFYRRHLSASQRALIVANGRAKISSSPMTIPEMVEKSGTSPQTVKDAVKVAENGSAVLNQAVREGEISVSKAAEIAGLPKNEQREALKEEKEKPPVVRKKSAKSAKTATVAKEKHEALIEKHNELLEENKELATELEGLQAVKDGDHAKELKKLQAQLKAAHTERDNAQNKAAQLQKQVKYLEAELKKLGWKKK